MAIPDFVFGGPFEREKPFTPDKVALAVEIGVSSAPYDRTVKRADYAAAGFPEYWLIEPRAQLVRVFRAPLDGEYGEAFLRRAGQALALPFAPELTLDPGDLL